MTTTYQRLRLALETAADLARGLLQIAWGTTGVDVFYPEPPEENGRNLPAGSLWDSESALDLLVQKVAERLERVQVTNDDATVGFLDDKIAVEGLIYKYVYTDPGTGAQTLRITTIAPP